MEENIFVLGVQLIFMYQRVSKDFIIKHLPDLLTEVKNRKLQYRLSWAVWNYLIDKRSLNRDIIEDTLELYLDPEGRNKFNTIKIKGE